MCAAAGAWRRDAAVRRWRHRLAELAQTYRGKLPFLRPNWKRPASTTRLTRGFKIFLRFALFLSRVVYERFIPVSIDFQRSVISVPTSWNNSFNVSGFNK